MDKHEFSYDVHAAENRQNVEKGQKWRQFVIGAIANLVVVCVGYCMGWTSPINSRLKDPSLVDSPLPEPITIDEEAWIGSILPIGAVLGTIFGGALASGIGRRWSLLACSIPLLIGWQHMLQASSVSSIYAGRLLWGIAVGMVFTVTPMYCAEIATFNEVFRGTNFKALYICSALIFFQQFSGINAVLFYMTNIFEAAGSDLDPSVASIIVGIVMVAASLVTSFVVDRLGRRLLLLFSACGTSIGLVLLGVFFYLEQQGNPIVDTISFLPVLSLVIYIMTFPVGLGAIAWAILSELISVEVKAKAAPIVTSFCWISCFLITRFFGPVSEALGSYLTFWMFGGFCVMAFFFVLFAVPETKGKSFTEIQEILARRTSRGKA